MPGGKEEKNPEDEDEEDNNHGEVEDIEMDRNSGEQFEKAPRRFQSNGENYVQIAPIIIVSSSD